MQFVNDDMDNLFRKAAENYPLSAEGIDWDKVKQKLKEAETLNKGKNNRKYWLLLLLLPIMFICNRFENKSGNTLQEINTEAQPSTTSTKGFKKVDQSSNKTNSLTSNRKSKTKQNAIFKQPNQTLQSSSKGAKTSNVYSNKTITDLKVGKISNMITHKTNHQISSANEKNFLNKNASTISLVVFEQMNYGLTTKVYNIPFLINADSLMHEWRKNNTKNIVDNRNKKWYAGITATPDLSFVKSAKANGVGFGYGVVGGYRLNNKWSIETGFLKDKKNYYADGAHFNATKTYLPNHSTIIHATGSCYMTELPLNIRYAVSDKENSSWVIAAGTSSYFMKKEEYDYLYERYGTQYNQYKKYNNNYSEWFSVINISGGLNKPMGRIGTLRIEPYVKIPLKGIGIGQLPVTSAGMNIGLIKEIR